MEEGCHSGTDQEYEDETSQNDEAQNIESNDNYETSVVNAE